MNSCACASRAACSTSLVGRVRHAEGDVLAHGRREQERVLRDDADLAAQRGERHVAHVGAVDRDAPCRHVVEARDERRERRLARAGVADQRDRPAGLELELDRRRSTGRSGDVAEGDVLEADAPGPAGARPRPGASRDLLRLVHHLEDALAGRGRALRLADPHAEHPQRHDEHREEQVEGDEVADRQRAVDDHASRRPAAPPPARAAAGTRSAARRTRAAGSPRTLCRKTDSDRASNFACSAGSWANDLTTWTPTMFSSATVATSAIFCWTSRRTGCETWL